MLAFPVHVLVDGGALRQSALRCERGLDALEKLVVVEFRLLSFVEVLWEIVNVPEIAWRRRFSERGRCADLRRD